VAAVNKNNKAVNLWPSEKAIENGVMISRSAYISGMAWHPTGCGRLAILDEGGRVAVFDTQGKLLTEFKLVEFPVWKLCWQPATEKLLAGTPTGLLICSENGKEQRLVPYPGGIYPSRYAWPDSPLLACTSGNKVVAVDAASYEPRWLAMTFSDGDSATFTAAGELVDGDSEVMDRELIYLLERDDGRLDLVKPSEFRKKYMGGK
jgi:hypothetical protein